MNGGRFIIVLVAFLCASSLAVPLNTNEEQARQFLETTNEQLIPIFDELSRVGLSMEYVRQFDPFHLLYMQDKIMEANNALAEIAREARKFDSLQFKDDDLKNTIELLGTYVGESSLGRSRFEQILKAVDNVEYLSYKKNIPKFRKKTVKLRYFPDIQKIISKSNNTQELRYYWKTWREENSDVVLPNLRNITEGLLETAKVTELPAIDVWMKGRNITEMEQIMNETEPLYLQLHAFIRYQLRKKYGGVSLEETIPDHLFQQVLAQAWTKGSIIDEMYPLEKLPPYNELLKQKNYDTVKLYKTADEFYKSLGFDSVSREFFRSNIRISKSADLGDCKSRVYDTSTNVNMLFCRKRDFRKFLQAHGYMGHVYYAREKKNVPPVSFGAYYLKIAVGEAAILSASTLKHLKTIGLLSNFELTDEVEFNRLLRMAIHTLINVRLNYVHTKVMADFFEGKVELGLLNHHYWKLMDQYLGVGPPMNRLSNTYDFPFKFYIQLNGNVQARKFAGEFMGYQFYEKLCQISGNYPAEPLHTCDFYGSQDVGNALKKMMQLGSTKRLKTVLATLLPDNPTLSADSFLKYYSPVKNWLVEKNQETGVKLGWTHSSYLILRLPTMRMFNFGFGEVGRDILDSSEEYDD